MRVGRLALIVACATIVAGVALPGSLGAGASDRPGRVVLGASGLGLVALGAGQRVATARLTRLLGAPSAYPPAGCVGGYADVEWHDLIVQFRHGRLSGYRYWDTQFAHGVVPEPAVTGQPGTPLLATAEGVTLGSTLAAVRRAYRNLVQSGTDFWRSGALTFGFVSALYPPPPDAPVYEIKVDACPAAL